VNSKKNKKTGRKREQENNRRPQEKPAGRDQKSPKKEAGITHQAVKQNLTKTARKSCENHISDQKFRQKTPDFRSKRPEFRSKTPEFRNCIRGKTGKNYRLEGKEENRQDAKGRRGRQEEKKLV